MAPGAAVAIVDGVPITETDVIDQDRAAFEKQQSDYVLRLRQLQLTQDQDRHELLQQQLDKLLDKRALELEAHDRHKTPEAILAGLKVPPVTEAEARAFYEIYKARANNQPFEQLQRGITEHLAAEHNAAATRSFYDALRARHKIVALLSPYRVAVATTGPSRGKADAPVTIVEFGDFQCPYCREVEPVLRTVLEHHPDAVRLVFRELPLSSIHPNAMAAAKAAVCADRQGMFWAMHDALYANQSTLSEAALQETAKRLGLQMDGFASCLSAPDTREAVDADSRAAGELNVVGTPHFFINGRPLHGSVPAGQFESVVADELQRIAAKRG